MDWDIQGKTAVVTGAAVGIGAAIAAELAAAGASVYGFDRDWKEKETGTQMSVDVTDAAAVSDALSKVASENRGIDILVNNAGTMRARDDFADYTIDDWQLIMSVNVYGMYFCISSAVEHMKDRNAAIVNIASGAGRNGRTLSPPYAASKSAVINLTRSSALALASKGIRVNAVAPGLIDTDFNQRLGAQFGPRDGLTPAEYVARRAEAIPLGRIGSPQDVAQVVCFLASPQASYLTGQTINVDGGLVMN